MQLVVAGVAVVLAATYFYGTTKIFVSPFADPAGPRAYPYLLVILLLIGVVVLLAEWWKQRATRPAAEHSAEAIRWSPLLPVAGWTLLYVLVFEAVGYPVATAIYLVVLMAFFNRGKWLANAVTSVGFSVVSYLVLVTLLGAQLPSGTLFAPLLTLFRT